MSRGAIGRRIVAELCGAAAQLRQAGARSSRAYTDGRYGMDKAKADPEAVIRQFEAGATPSSDQSVAEYVKALVYTGRLDGSALVSTIRRGAEAGGRGAGGASYSAAPAPSSTPFGAFGASAAAAGAEYLGSASRPLYMQMLEPSGRAQAWRAVRSLGTAFIVISAIGALMEDKGAPMRGMLGGSSEPKPALVSKTRFADVRGVDEAKGELLEIVEYLKNPARFTALGGKLPKGVLLVGPPGTGKTMLAKAVAGEAGVPFFYASGSEFEEMFVGVGARRVRELFAAAKKSAPCIIFLDEIDAIGGARNPKDQSYMKMTLNQLLVELDGFRANEGIIVIAATNFPESLDKALVRPGRFDRHVVVPNPDVEGRRQILEAHVKGIKTAADVQLKTIARGTPGFSGADLANLVNVAALRAAMLGKAVVSQADLEYAKDRVMMGAERKSAVISEENRRLTAYHEGGHAIVAVHTAGAHPVHKATIVPRGMSLGMVMQLPEKDETSVTRRQLLARLDVCMGGRVAEELVFGEAEVTTGASSDLQQATRLARDMVTKYGMGRGVGLVSQEYEDGGRSMSSETRAAIEGEVKAILAEAHDRAAALLRKHTDELHLVAQALLAEETLTGAELKELLARKGTSAAPPAAASASRVASAASAAAELAERAKAAAKGAAPV